MHIYISKHLLPHQPSNILNSNKADLRVLKTIHKQLGIKSPDALLASRKREAAASSSLSASMRKKPAVQSKLKVFASVLRAVARMRIGAKQWGEHERTRKKLVSAWEESRSREPAEIS